MSKAQRPRTPLGKQLWVSRRLNAAITGYLKQADIKDFPSLVWPAVAKAHPDLAQAIMEDRL